MASTFRFVVTAVLERESGKFMPRDEMYEQVFEAIEGADPGSVEGGADGDSVYEVTEWDVADA